MKWRFAFVFTVLITAACHSSKLQKSGCETDADCGSVASAYRCETQTGVCYCRTNDACRAVEFCNPAGFCQNRAGCEKNADCIDPSLYCETTTGTCLPAGRCTRDLECPLGQVCDLNKSSCVVGCHFAGDCPGSSCRCDTAACQCAGTTPEEIQKCKLGVCDTNFCADSTFCRFGEKCGVQGDAGTDMDAGTDAGTDPTATASCYSDFDPQRRPYCGGCTSGGGLSTCGRGANYCLIDTTHPGNYFCGVDCYDGQTCPHGYSCQDVIVVQSNWQCTRANPSCPPNPALPCTVDSECKHGGSCVIAAGQTVGACAGKCGIDEGDSVGYCSCQVDQDCEQDTCSGGECTISRRTCVTGANGECRPIRCVDFHGAGGCFIGQNCAPANGLSCLEVQ